MTEQQLQNEERKQAHAYAAGKAAAVAEAAAVRQGAKLPPKIGEENAEFSPGMLQDMLDHVEAEKELREREPLLKEQIQLIIEDEAPAAFKGKSQESA